MDIWRKGRVKKRWVDKTKKGKMDGRIFGQMEKRMDGYDKGNNGMKEDGMGFTNE